MRKYADEVRANEFDQRIGLLQTYKVIELGVGESILDIGCGVGMFTPTFKGKWKRVVGLDPSEKFLEEARKNSDVEYVQGYGETFELDEKFDTITMNMLLEHVDDPVALLRNCKKHLNKGGRILAQVPNSTSMTRQIGVLMGILDSTDNITDRERDYFGHQRVYTLATLEDDAIAAGLNVVEIGGLLHKPLPNSMLGKICDEQGEEWAEKFIQALVEFGKDRPEECANLYMVCK